MSTPAQYVGGGDEDLDAKYGDFLDRQNPQPSTPPAALTPTPARAPLPIEEAAPSENLDTKYGSFLDEQDADQLRRGQAVQGIASKYNPAQYAEAVKLGREFGIDAKTVADNPEPYRKESAKRAATGMLKDAPVSREWLTGLDNAAVAQDDVENLANIERSMTKVSALTRAADIGRSIPSGFYQAFGMAESGIGRLYGAGSRAFATALDTGLRAIGAQSVADFLSKPREGLQYVNPEYLLLQLGTATEQQAASIGAPIERQNLATDIAGGLGQITGQIAVALTGGEIPSILSLLGQGADIQGDRAEAAGASQEQIDRAVMVGSLVTAITEKYQLDRLLKEVPAGLRQTIFDRIKSIAMAGVSEAAQEVAEGIGQNLTAKALYDPEAAIFQGWERDAQAAGGAGAIAKFLIDAIVPGHARSGPSGTADREADAQLSRLMELSKQHESVARGEATGKLSAELLQLVTQANLTQRSPEQLESFAAAVKEKTGVEFAYVDPKAFRTLFQSDDEANRAANEYTGSPNTFTYYEAAISGAPLAVPIEKYLSRLAPKAAEQQVEGKPFSDYVAFDPESLNANEAASTRDALLEEARKAAEREATDAATETSQAIYEDQVRQLVAAGMEQRTAEFNATLMRAAFRTLGERAGIDPLELYNRYQLKVRGQFEGDATSGGTELTQGAIESPEFKQWFGASKVVDEAGAPLVVYKAMHPYDWTKEAADDPGPLITSIQRTTPFPAFNGDEPGIDIAGFFGSKETANHFAAGSQNSAIYPVFLSLQNPYVIDAKGQKAGAIQFGKSGKPFRDAVRSGKYDGVIIRGTSDEGDLYVALKPSQIKSAIGNRGTFDPASDNILFQSDRGPIWVSALTQAAENVNIKGDKAGAADWISKLRKSEGVKEEEIEWSGLEDWLKKLGRSATKQEVVEYLRRQELRIVDVPKGAAAAGIEPTYDMDAISDVVDQLQDFASQYRASVEEDDSNYFYNPPSADDYTSTQTITREPAEEGGEAVDEEVELSVTMGRIELGYSDDNRASVDVTVTFPDGRTLAAPVEIDADDGYVRVPSQRYFDYDNDEFTDNELDAAESALNEMTAVPGEREMDGEVERRLEAVEGLIGDAVDELSGDSPDIESARYSLTKAYNKLPDGHDRVVYDLREKLGEILDEAVTPEAVHNMPARRLAGKSEDYFELLLTLPDVRGTFKEEVHFDEENFVAHVRGDVRTDADGVRTLYIDEVQSDWHQQGREYGYKGDPSLVPEPVTELPAGWSWAVVDEPRGATLYLYHHGERRDTVTLGERPADTPENEWVAQRAVETYNDLQKRAALKEEANRVPDAPFKDSAVWSLLVMKRMIRYAVENDIDRIAWSPGQVQVDRWGLEHLIESIQYSRNNDAEGTYAFKAFEKDTGKKIMDEPAMTLKDIRRHIGAELTNSIEQGIGDEVKDPWNEQPRTWRSLSKEGLKVGGAGMIHFYDSVIPSALNKFVKKYGAKVGSTKIDAGLEPDAKTMVAWTGNDGLIHTQQFDDAAEASNFAIGLRASGEGNDAAARRVHPTRMLTVQSLDITPALRKAALAGLPMFQRSANIEADASGKRGSITWGTDRKFTINLFEKRDLSTYLHESGHLYLEILGDLAEDANTPQQIKDDYATLLKWFGVKDRASIGVEQHEQFARGFEAYLAEGKAPSVELQPVFFRFRQWMLAVYKAIRNLGNTPGSIGAALNVSLTDEVRAVMDRLVATDEQIAEAEKSQQYAPIFTNAEAAGMSEAEWSAYRETVDRAHRESVDELTGRAMAELAREKKQWWKDERKRVMADVTVEVNASPLYRALAFLTKGKNPDGSALAEGTPTFKLSRADIDKALGPGVYKTLPRGSTATDGVAIDTAAQALGFPSGIDMVRALIAAPAKKVVIERLTDARMRERHGDMMLDGSMVDKAIDSVHTEARAKVLAAELRALRQKMAEAAPFVNAAERARASERTQAREANAATLPTREEMKAIKLAAQRAIAAKKIRDINPQLYRNAERKAAKRAFEMAGKGKFEDAYLAKRQQILNYELFRAATDARTQVDKQVDYMRGLAKKSAQERLAKAKGQYRDQINALLTRFDFTAQPLDTSEKRAALAKWVDEQIAAGREVNIPQWVIDEARRTPYKELTAAELEALVDAAKNIEHLAKTKDRLLRNREAAQFAQAKLELEARARESLKGGRAPPVSQFEVSWLKERVNRGLGFLDSLVRAETLIEWLDGGTSGPWHDFFMEPANNAEYARESLRTKILGPMRKLANNIDKKRRAELNESIHIESLGQAFNRRTLISIVLNMGNASNLERLLKGGFRDATNGNRIRKFTPGSLNEIKGKLNKADWQMIQEMWTTAESLWPELKAFQERVGGLVPEKITPTPIETRFGTFTGGYWPVVYDSLASKTGVKQADMSDALGILMGANFTKASTNKSALQARTGAAGPLKLDFSAVMGRHLDQVITDITHREFAVQAMRILDDKDLRLTLQDTIGEVGWASLRGMVAATIQQDAGFGDIATREIENTRSRLISKLAVAALGFKLTTAFGNLVLAPIQAGARVKPQYILTGIAKFMASKEARDFVHASSEMMRNRAQNMDASFGVIREKLEGRSDMLAKTQRAAMAIHHAADYLATTGIWLGRYNQAVDAGANHEEAVRLADKAIRTTQTAGAPKDLSAFERHPAYRELKLFLGPMVIMNNRIREALTKKGMIKSWPEALGALMAAWLLPAVIWDLVTGRGPGDDDDDGNMLTDEFLPWALRKIAVYPFMTMPYWRDAVGLVDRKLSGGYAEPRMTPAADAIYMVVKTGMEAANQLSEDDADDSDDAKKLTRAGLNVAGPLIGLPTGQIDITGSYIWDAISGEHRPEDAADLRYLIMRRPKDK